MRNAYVPPPHVGIQWPDGDDELSADAVDLISKLLAIEPTDRLGAKGADEVKAHPWFAGVDWANLRNTTSPFVPKLGKSEDTFYFEARNAIYHTTWEGDTSTQAEEGEEHESHVARVRNFSIINIPQLMTLNQSLVDEKQGKRYGHDPSARAIFMARRDHHHLWCPSTAVGTTLADLLPTNAVSPRGH